MVTINKVYTKQGDQGSTVLVGGSKRSKADLRVESYGELDELQSFLGDARTKTEEKFPHIAEKIALVQNELFDIGAELATPDPKDVVADMTISMSQVERIEAWIDEVNESLSPLKSFVLPGGTLENAALHICRAVARRAERCIVELSEKESVRPEIAIYLNRLSDLLFVLARACGPDAEYLWVPGKSRELNNNRA